MPLPVSVTLTVTPFAIRGRDPQRPSRRHRILRVQEQIQEHLLQPSGIAVDRAASARPVRPQR